MKNFLRILLIASLLLPSFSMASHLMGGEITWQCLKTGPNAGRFVFRVKLYRDCNGTFAPNSVNLDSNSPVANILCNQVSITDISPVSILANGQPNLACPTCAAPQGLPNAVQELIYESAPILINGVPPATGWYFSFNLCCRNNVIVNLVNPGSGSFTLRALMFPYNATNTNPCFDSSPQFAERPQLATCPNNLTAYNANAIDPELDSLVYSWAQPLASNFPNPTNFPFAPGYSFTNPMPSAIQNPLNVPAALNPVTGVVTFTSFTSGAFVTVTKVSAYKCGKLVAEIYREIQIAILSSCVINQPPNLAAFNTPPDMIPPPELIQLSPNEFLDTVYAGDTVRFSVSATDFEQQPPPNPPGNFQLIKFSATGIMFGGPLGNQQYGNPTSGCPYPPCATIEDPFLVLNNFVFGSGGVTFNWVTSCNHLPKNLGCVTLSSTYNFVIKVFDNFCPSPAVNFNTYTITVLAPPSMKWADMKCADVLPSGQVQLSWTPPIDTGKIDTNKYFKSYWFYRSTTGIGGPYTLIDSLKYTIIPNGILLADKLRDSIRWTDATANANAGPVFYYMRTRSGCEIDTARQVSDTISTIYLTVNQVGNNASLSWTPQQVPLAASTTKKYYIERQYPAGTGAWTLIDSTTTLTYLDPVSVCNDSVNYRISVKDTSSHPCCPGGTFCISRSNITGKTLSGPIPVIRPPSLRCASVLPNGNIQLSWVASVDTASIFVSYEIYGATTLAGPYTKLGSVTNYNLNNYTHVGANGQNIINYYYIRLKAGCDLPSAFESVPSDTLSSIRLQVTPSLGLATLNWNAQRTPLLPSSSANYLIYYRYPPQVTWTYAGDTTRTTYTVPIILCDTLIEWKVEIADNSGCISTSSLDQDQFTSLGDVIANPSLRCLAVQPNGDVQLSWAAAPDPNNFFAGIQVYESSSLTGPYTLLTTINTNSGPGGFLHVGANANTAIRYYYLRSLSGCDGTRFSGTSDTLATMRLTVSNATLGQANLSWNAMRTPNLASAPGKYFIKRRTTGVGPYVLIDSTVNRTYTNVISQCNVPYEYIIELNDNLPCTSVSSAANGTFTYLGNIVPHPLLHCVSVLPNGQIQLTWEVLGTSTDFNEFEVWRSTTGPGGPFTLIDSVQAFAQFTYTDATANGNLQSYSYYLKSQSGCDGQQSPAGTSNIISSIYLTATPVLGQANLSWSALSNPLPPSSNPAAYQIDHTYNATGAWINLGSTTNLTTTQAINDCDTTIQHVVYVNDNICVSRSNVVSKDYTYTGNIVASPDLRCVSVLPSGQIQLTWVAPTGSSQHFNEFEIWRNSGAGFTRIDSVGTFAQTTFTDITANGNAQSYSYYMLSQSGCTGQLNSLSNSATISSIYLTSTGALGQANLSWNAHPLLPTSTPAQYMVYSDYNPVGPGQYLGGTNTLTFSQPVSDCDTTITYSVKVADNSGCVSESNRDVDNYTYTGNIVAPPDLRCVSVLPSGQIQLTWVAPSGSSQHFNEFEIWRNSGAGFTRIDSVGVFAQTTFTDITANGNAQSYSYYMLSQSGCSGQINSLSNSATVSSIYLTSTGALGQTNLSWNAHPLLPTSTPAQYMVYSDYNPVGPGQYLGGTNTLTFSQPVSDCDTTITYSVKVADNSGCVSESNIDIDNYTYIGNIVNAPDFRCVSVLPSGQIQLTWESPTGSNQHFNEFEIWRNTGAGFTRIDSINNFAQTSFTDVSANGNNQSYSYYLLSQSGCTGQVNSLTNSTTLSSIYLTTTGVLGQANLQWSGLPIIPSSNPQQYLVYSDYKPVGPGQFLGDTTVLNYFQPVSDCDTTITYRVAVNDNSGCVSESNRDVDNYTYLGNVIENPEIRCASVNPNGQVLLTFVNPSPSSWQNFNQYDIYRNSGSGFVLIDSTDRVAPETYLDINANGNAGAITYTMVTRAGCTGQVAGFNGDTLSTIHLVVSGGNTSNASLNWNAQRTPLLPTSAGLYKVEREFPGGSGNWTVAGTTANTTFNEPLTVCIDSVNYRISIADAICTSMSNVDGEVFVDYSKPAPPELRCVSVLANGQVQLTWIPPTDTARRYNSYHIFGGSSASGPWQQLDSIFNYSTTTFNHAGANGQTTPWYYRIQTRSGCGVRYSDDSDTLRTINVNVINNNGVAIVNWNPVHFPELPTASQQYTVYKEYPAGVWNQFGPVLNATYSTTDTINVCSAIINYRVETGDALGCTSRSSIDGDLFRDVTRPVTPAMDTVSLDPLNPTNVTLSWLPSSSGDVVGYIIYLFNGASWDSIGGTFSNGPGSMLHINPNAPNGIQTYSIAAFDSCGNRSFIAPGHNTMRVQSKLDVCRAAIDLFWNPYLNMVGDVAQYNIYVSENGGPYNFLASVPGNNVSYSHTNLVNNTDYCYYIQAQGTVASRTASSTKSCIKAELLELPTFSYLRYATVRDVRRVRVEALVDTVGNPDVSRYKLQRSFNENGPFITVGIVNYAYQPEIIFEDYTARTDEYSYYYRVITLDSCGNEVLISNLGRTLLLGGSPEFNLTNRLTWNTYKEWLGGLREYALFRKVDDTWDPVAVGTVGNVFSPRYTDDVSEIYQTSGRFCYRVEAYEGAGNQYGYTDTSVSNIFCLIQEPHLFIPNAFTPGGKNPVLKPEHIYIDIDKYFFAVFNRWGQKVFETADPQAGWDGTYNGSIAPEGNYVYSVRIYGTNGREIEKNGTVTLLR